MPVEFEHHRKYAFLPACLHNNLIPATAAVANIEIVRLRSN